MTIELINIVVDGMEISAPKGQLLLEACADHGIEIPNFCYYRDLPPQAACRMCLVYIEKMPRLQTACTVRILPGMVVTTNSQEILQTRKGMVDFILANHPLDCPVCDKGGECELQNMSLRHGALYARYTEEKDATGEYPLSPFIWLDPQRCILCYRCIRVCDEWMGDHALGVLGRGAHSRIVGNLPDGQLECENCGNCVEVCPVGALTSSDFRFRARPWDIQDTISTCTYCADGCQLKLSARGGRIVRAWAKDLTGINQEFLCIKGRYGNEFVNSTERLQKPLVRHNGKLFPSSWEDAIGMVAERLEDVRRRHGAESIACVGSPRLTNEDLYALNKFGRQVIGTPRVSHITDVSWRSFVANLTAPLATQTDIRSGRKTLILIGGNPPEYNPLTAYSLRRAVQVSGARLFVISAQPLARLKETEKFLHIRKGSEAAVLLALLDETKLDLAARQADLTIEDLRALRHALSESKEVVFLIGKEVRGVAMEAAAALGARWQNTDRSVWLHPLLRFNNSMGALDMGLMDEPPGLDEIGSSVRALYLVGCDLIRFYGEHWTSALERAELIVVHELFMTRTAAQAHVVLPAMSFAEIDGTFTNGGGQVQRVRRARDVAGDWRPDWLIISQIAKMLGMDLGDRGSISTLLKEISQKVEGYEQASFAVLGKSGAIAIKRSLRSDVDWSSLLPRLDAQVAQIDPQVDSIGEPARLGLGLFELGTLTEHVPLLVQALRGHGTGTP